MTVDVAERRFDGSSWGEVSERKLQADFIKKIDGKKIKFLGVLPLLGLLRNFFSRGGQNLERDLYIRVHIRLSEFVFCPFVRFLVLVNSGAL